MTQNPLLDIVHPDVAHYVASLSTETDPLVIRMASYAQRVGFPWLGYSGAQWIENLSRMIGAKRAFEFGSGFGYSAYFLARAVGEDGEVHGSEPNAEILAAHDELFGDHPYKKRIHLHGADGFSVLNDLPGLFDVVFIDLDKPYYPDALKASVERVRVGGLILADNTLWSGRVCEKAGPDDRNTAALQEFNQMAHNDARLRTGILPAGDGLSVSLRTQ